MKYEVLKESVYNLYSNFLTEIKFRESITEEKSKELIQYIIYQTTKFDISKVDDVTWVCRLEALLWIFVNLTYQAN